jgi:hypothetical protein
LRYRFANPNQANSPPESIGPFIHQSRWIFETSREEVRRKNQSQRDASTSRGEKPQTWFDNLFTDRISRIFHL